MKETRLIGGVSRRVDTACCGGEEISRGLYIKGDNGERKKRGRERESTV